MLGERDREAAVRVAALGELDRTGGVACGVVSVPLVPGDRGERGLAVGGAREVARRLAGRNHRLRELAGVRIERRRRRLRDREEQKTPLVVVARRELERTPVERDGVVIGTERARAVAGGAQRFARRPLEQRRVRPRRTRELERLCIVVCDQVGPLSAARGDPLGGEAVLLAARSTWELCVRDVADERVPEGEL